MVGWGQARTHVSLDDDTRNTAFPEVAHLRKKHSKKLILAHLNICGMRQKIHDVNEILSNKYVAIFGLSETKIRLVSHLNLMFKILNFIGKIGMD